MSNSQNKNFFQSILGGLTEPINPRKINITVFGPRGVGKTSLLTAMSEQFDKTTQKTVLMLTPEVSTSVILQAKKAELKSCFDNSDELEVKGGIGANLEPQDFEYTLAKAGMSKCVQLYFKDFPGGYLESEVESVKTLLDKSMIVLIAIDAPALMEEEGKWHQEINKPDLVTTYFKKAYQNIKEPRLVMFVPIKCEKYMRKDSADLLRCVQKGYDSLIDFFGKPNVRSQVVTVVTPIQTLGNVEFSRIKVQNLHNSPYPIFYFRKTNPPLYAPKDCEQPLRYLLRFLIKIHLEERFVLWKAIRKVIGGLLEDKAFKEAAIEFAKNCNTTGGFAILQDDQGCLNLGK